MDQYDEQIQRIKGDICKISSEFVNGLGIFKFTGKNCGCPHEIKVGIMDGPSRQITEEIRADSHLKTLTHLLSDPNGAGEGDLQVYAKWQRRVDREFQRV